MTFRERYMAGKADFDEIFDLTDQWNFSDETCTLREYLGLTAQEEDIWISESDEALEAFMEHEKKRRIFFTDLDGTLLNDDHDISDGNRSAIKELLQKGHVVVICTGRAFPSAKLQAERLGLTGENCYIICFNGGQIYDSARRELIYRKSIPMNYVRSVFDDADKFGITAQTYTDTHVITEHDNPNTKKYGEIQGLPMMVVENVTKTLSHDPSKILALDFFDNQKVTDFRQFITAHYDGVLDAYLSHPALLELVPPGVNKGNAVRFLCNYLGIPIENSVAAGDAENDLTMIQAAHIGAVMVNGEPFMKEQADYVTEADNNHDGVAEILHKFILSGD